MTRTRSKIKTILQNEFLWYLTIGILFCAYPLVQFEKGHSVLVINHTVSNSTLDSFFRVFTEIGNGAFLAFIVIIQLLKSYKKAFIIAITGIIILVVSLLLKHIVFPDSPRPTNFLPTEAFSHLIDNFEYARHNSFPSGHTTSAFGLMGVLSYIYTNKYSRIGLFALAALAGFSRMYLLQHFLIDVFTGAIIGFSTASLVFTYWEEATFLPNGGLLKAKSAELS